MINSISNKQVRRVVNLRTKTKVRREEGAYIAEGLRMCKELSRADTESLYVTEAFEAVKENRLWLRGYPYELVAEKVMNVMADTKTPQGVLAVARQKRYCLDEILYPPSKPGRENKLFLMVLENIQDPGNLGTIIRAGEGAGITGVIMSRETADIYNPKVIRSTMGSVLRVPFVYAEDLKKTLESVKNRGIKLYAAHLDGMYNYDQEDYTDHVGFLIGNEANGLTEETAGLADSYIKIPMAGQVESLNAAVAASVLMFEASRQRRNR